MDSIVSVFRKLGQGIKGGIRSIIGVIRWWFNKMANSGSNPKTLGWAVSGLMVICLACYVPLACFGTSLGLFTDNTSVAVEPMDVVAEQKLDLEVEENSDLESVLMGEPLAALPTDTSTATAAPTDTTEPSATPKPTNTPRPTNTSRPTATSLPVGMALVTDVNNDSVIGEEAVVNYVVDGDTINVVMNGQEYRVRYIGINTPEQGDPFAEDATQANQELVLDQTVIMVKDVSETDRYGRLLRYVYLPDGTMVNAELVQRGYAQAATYPPDVNHEALFLELQQAARSSGRGLWAQPVATSTPVPIPTSTPVPIPTSTPAPLPSETPIPPPPADTPVPPPPTEPPAPPANCDPSYPDFCIPPPPPDLDCGDIPQKRFRVLQPDPHRFDGDKDGIGCES